MTEDNVYLNTTMLSDPIFEKDYIAIPLDGSISMIKEHEENIKIPTIRN